MFTIVDLVEQGRVTILFSLQQMKNLNITLDMRPDKVLITGEALGLHRAQATRASSSHIELIVLQYVACPRAHHAVMTMLTVVSLLVMVRLH